MLCVVLRKLHGEHLTFSEDPNGDGFIVDINTGEFISTEHVSALENPFNKLPKGESRVISAINLKIDKGSEYAKGKWLVVFLMEQENFIATKLEKISKEGIILVPFIV